MNRGSYSICLALVAATCAAACGGGRELWIAPNGRADAPGTREQPLATLEGARDALRRLRRAGPLPPGDVTVWLRGGTYTREATFELASEDSGSATGRIVYRAAAGETVRLAAGRLVSSERIHAVTDPAVRARLDPAARDKVLAIDLRAMKCRNLGPPPDVFNDGGGYVELYVNDRRMPRARWPNEGYATIARVLDKGDAARGPKRHGGRFVYRDDRPSRWPVDEGIWLDGFWRVPWQPETVRVQAIDATQREITLAAPVGGGIGSKYAGPAGSGKEPWCAINLLEEIDRPGEWCLDFRSGVLYFWPPAPLEGARVVIADNDGALVRLKDASWITLRGLSFEQGLGNGVEVAGGSDNLVAGCTLRNLGRTGVVIRGGRRNGVAGCNLYALGHGGIYLDGGDRKTLAPAENFAVNNHIHHYGLLKRTYAPGIALGAYQTGPSVGNRAAHNLIHDSPHAGVLYGGNDNVLELNEVHHVALDSGDVGAFYTCNDWTSRGNVLRHNFVHQSPAANAFYLDDGDSGDTVVGNVVFRTQYGPFVGGGHDNLVRNNLIIDCPRAIHLDARGVTRGYGTSPGLRAKLKSVPYTQPPWSTRYPELVTILDFHPELPTGNVIESNVCVGCQQALHLGGKKQERLYSKIGANLELTIAEAGLVDPARLDFRLKPDSAVYRKLPDFRPIPFEQIGLVRDEFRGQVPPRLPVGQSGGGGVFDSDVDVQRSNRRP